jgi:hypothetical protein
MLDDRICNDRRARDEGIPRSRVRRNALAWCSMQMSRLISITGSISATLKRLTRPKSSEGSLAAPVEH